MECETYLWIAFAMLLASNLWLFLALRRARTYLKRWARWESDVHQTFKGVDG